MLRFPGVRPRTTVEAYIHEQPAVLRRIFDDVPALVAAVQPELPARPGGVVLIGSGTSGHALMAVRALIARRLACPVFVCGPLAFIAEAPMSAAADSLAIVLSQSGASRTTVEAVGVARARHGHARDHRGGRALLPGSGRAAARAFVGHDAQR